MTYWRLDVVATVIAAMVSVVGAVRPDPLDRGVAFVGVALFLIGIVAFLWAFLIAIERSRTEVISPPQLYFLYGGIAPTRVRNGFAFLFATQFVVGLVVAAIRPDTDVPFALLVPMFGLGMSGMWGARFGTFPARRQDGDSPAQDLGKNAGA